jgi:hypothetical protein
MPPVLSREALSREAPGSEARVGVALPPLPVFGIQIREVTSRPLRRQSQGRRCAVAGPW